MRLLASLALRLALLLLLAGPFSARAEDDAREAVLARESATFAGAAASGLCGLVHAGAPLCARGVTLSASAGYGATLLRGRHDRALGSLAVALTPVDWLALSLELLGRIDAHPRDAQGRSVTGTGDPVLRARAGLPLKPRGLSLGGELGLWLPGSEAPSFRARSLTPELKLLLALRSARFHTLGFVGVRIDQSFNSAPDLARVRPVDRVALGLSDSHALLVGLGLSYRATAQLSLFGELSADVLLGKQAPAFLESPLRAAVAARYFVLPPLQLELMLQSSLSQRPAITPSAPLVPIEPRIAVLLGLRFTLGGPKPKSTPPPPVLQVPDPAPPAPRPLARLSGVVTDGASAPLPEVSVTLRLADGALETISDAQGRFSFEQLPEGKAELRADAAGFKSAQWDVEITQRDTQLPARALEPGQSTGMLRCLVRSFDSATLKASISVRDARGKRAAAGRTDENGSLELALPPGQYRVMIEAAGFRSQRTQVQVAANEVAILNVDMRTIE